MTIDFGDHMVTARKFTHRNAAQCNAFALHCILCCIVTAHPSNPRAYNTPKLKFLPTVTRSALTLLTNTVTPLNYYVVCSTSRLPHTISRYNLLLVTLITSLGHTTIGQHNRSRDAQHATVASRCSLRRAYYLQRLYLPYVSTNGSNEFAHSPRAATHHLCSTLLHLTYLHPSTTKTAGIRLCRIRSQIRFRRLAVTGVPILCDRNTVQW